MQLSANQAAFDRTQLRSSACHEPAAKADGPKGADMPGCKTGECTGTTPHLLPPWWLLLLRLLLRPALPGPPLPCGAAP